MTRDKDIRPLVLALAAQESPGARILGEVGLLQGACLVDVAAISAARLHGYEIKADADTLRRLPAQVAAYSRVLDRCTLVAGTAHIRHALPLLPSWWGVVRAWTMPDGTPVMEVERQGAESPSPCARATADLLWRPESLALLERLGAAKGVRSAAKNTLRDRLVAVLPADELRARVRAVVAARDWRRA